MNKLNVLATILCLTIFINGCQKDSTLNNTQPENQVQNADIESRSYDEETCGTINDLCLRCIITGEVLDEEVEVKFPDLARQEVENIKGIDNNYLEIVIDGEKYTIRPATYFGGKTQEYLITTPKGNYITSNIKNDYVNSKALDVKLPNTLGNIYKLDHERFIHGKLSFDEVKRTFGKNTKLLGTKDEGYRISITDIDVSSGIGSIFYAPCYGVTMSALVLDYQEILGMNDPHTNAAQIIEAALYANTPAGFDPKTDCHNTQDVVGSILNDPLIAGSSHAPNQIKLNYLDALLNLDQDEYKWLYASGASTNFPIITEIYDDIIQNQNLTDCAKADCSLKASYRQIINLLHNETPLTSSEKQNIVTTYSDIYCNDRKTYNCLRQIDNTALQYSLIAFPTLDAEIKDRILTAACDIENLDDTYNFSGLDNPINYPEQAVIENGIDILEIEGGALTPCVGTFIGHNVDRNNTEDIGHGLDGDGTGIELANQDPPETNDELFATMRNLFFACTAFSFELEDVGQDFIDLFEVNDDPDLEHIDERLNQRVADSRAMKDFVKIFGEKLNTELSGTNGDINGVFAQLLLGQRPRFNSLRYRFYGLQILINDTEYTKIYLEDGTYEYDPATGRWSAWFCFDVEDHFGLDRNDAITFQGSHPGFPAWWMLQHQRNYVPFHTKVLVRARLSGEIEI